VRVRQILFTESKSKSHQRNKLEKILLAANLGLVNRALQYLTTMTSIFSSNFVLAVWMKTGLLAQVTSETETTTTAAPTISPILMIIWLAVVVLMIASMWKIFTKAGQPGWASLIPIYNIYVWCKIVGRPGWWVLLFFIPFVNFVIAIILGIDLAKSFGKGVGFGIGIILLGIIFLPILAFSGATYQGPSAGAAS